MEQSPRCTTSLSGYDIRWPEPSLVHPQSGLPKQLNIGPLTPSIFHDVTSRDLYPTFAEHHLFLSFDIPEPKLDKLYHLPVDPLDLGWFSSGVSQSVLIPVMDPIYHDVLNLQSVTGDDVRGGVKGRQHTSPE